MIRINLLGGERPKVRRTFAFDIGHQVTLACGVVLVATALGLGWWYRSIDQASRRVDAELASAQQDATRLRTVLAEVRRSEAARGQLQQRVTLIQQLRRGQGIPVQLLDHVSRSLPEMLWLTDLKEEGDFLTIEGRTTTLIGLSDFVNNLGTNAVLQKPIEILDSAAEGGESKTGAGPDLIKFTVRAGLNGLPPQEEPVKGGAKKKVKR